MATIIYNDPTKSIKTVKNLHWLLVHASEVNRITVIKSHGTRVFLFAHFDNKVFVSPFFCIDVCRDWLTRSRAFKDVPVEFCGEIFLAGYVDTK